MKNRDTLIIKRYPGDKAVYVLDLNGNFVCFESFHSIDAAIEWCKQRYPESSTRVMEVA